MKNIVLIGARLSDNLGGPSLAVSTVEVLKSVYPEAKFTLLVPEKAYANDQKIEGKYPLSVMPFHAEKILLYLWIKRWFKLSIGPWSLQKTVNAILHSDMIVDIWGIMFADSFRSKSFISKFREGLRLTFGKLVNIPMVKYTVAMGPFQSKWNRLFAKWYLNQFVDIIFARDEITERHLKILGINTETHGAPDTAFLLPVSNHHPNVNNENLVGISVSYQARNRYSNPADYTLMIANLINNIIQKYDTSVLLIPNEIESGTDDDKKIAVEINRLVVSDQCDVLDTSHLSAMDIKNVISQCEAVIAARYHTIIAALSLGIPVLALGWHHKYKGVLQLFHQDEYLLDVNSMDLHQAESKFETLWKNRVKVRSEILSHIESVKYQVLNVGKHIRNKIGK